MWYTALQNIQQERFPGHHKKPEENVCSGNDYTRHAKLTAAVVLWCLHLVACRQLKGSSIIVKTILHIEITL